MAVRLINQRHQQHQQRAFFVLISPLVYWWVILERIGSSDLIEWVNRFAIYIYIANRFTHSIRSEEPIRSRITHQYTRGEMSTKKARCWCCWCRWFISLTAISYYIIVYILYCNIIMLTLCMQCPLDYNSLPPYGLTAQSSACALRL